MRKTDPGFSAKHGTGVLVPGRREVDKTRLPKPPSGVRASVRALWWEYWADPISQTYSDSDIGLLRRWSETWELYYDALEQFKSCPLTEGSQGQPILSPWHAVLDSSRKAILTFENQLGLSPLSRARLGVQLGEAKKSLEQHAREAAAQGPAPGQKGRHVRGRPSDIEVEARKKRAAENSFDADGDDVVDGEVIEDETDPRFGW